MDHSTSAPIIWHFELFAREWIDLMLLDPKNLTIAWKDCRSDAIRMTHPIPIWKKGKGKDMGILILSTTASCVYVPVETIH